MDDRTLSPPNDADRRDVGAPAGTPAAAADPLRGGHDPQALAARVRDGMLADDRATRHFGIEVTAVGPGTATVEMTVQAHMLNGFGTCHGGVLTVLADSAFAFACNSHNTMAVAAGLSMDFLRPAHAGDRLAAEAVELSCGSRSGLYDVTVRNQRGERVAAFRGRAHRFAGRAAVPLPARGAPEGSGLPGRTGSTRGA